jgi:hypothetical protein
MQVDLADSQSTTVEVANNPGGRLQALNMDPAALVTAGPAGLVSGRSGWLLGDIRVHQPAPTTVGPAR